MKASDHTTSLVIPPDLRDEAIFGLLSANTAAQYAREARRISGLAGVRDYILWQLGAEETAVHHGATLWAEVERQELRDLAEFELAVLLPVVARFSSTAASTLLEEIRGAEGHSAWLRVLAGGLLVDRA